MDNIGDLMNKIVSNLTPDNKTKIGNELKIMDGIEYLKNRKHDKSKLKKNLRLIEGFTGFKENSSMDEFIDDLSKFSQYNADFHKSYNEIKDIVKECKGKCYSKTLLTSGGFDTHQKYGCDVACTLKGPITGDCPNFDKTVKTSASNKCNGKPYYEILDDNADKSFLGNIMECDELKDELKKTSMTLAQQKTARDTCNGIMKNTNNTYAEFEKYATYNNDLRNQYKNINDWGIQIEDREKAEKAKIERVKDRNDLLFSASNGSMNDFGENINKYQNKYRTYKKMSGETDHTLISMNRDISEKTRTKKVYYYLWGILALTTVSLAAIQIKKRIR